MIDQFRIMKSYEKISPFFVLLITNEETTNLRHERLRFLRHSYFPGVFLEPAKRGRQYVYL